MESILMVHQRCCISKKLEFAFHPLILEVGIAPYQVTASLHNLYGY
jgi:hypothetical protein